MQKTRNESCLLNDRLEAESIEGAQTFMEITEGELITVQIDEKHLLEYILSPYNMNRAYRKVVSNGGCRLYGIKRITSISETPQR